MVLIFYLSLPSFPPLGSWQYDKRRDSFDSSSKRRVPAWTDRILYKPLSSQGKPVKLLSYTSIPECRHSDHRPVMASFTVSLPEVDKEELERSSHDDDHEEEEEEHEEEHEAEEEEERAFSDGGEGDGDDDDEEGDDREDDVEEVEEEGDDDRHDSDGESDEG